MENLESVENSELHPTGGSPAGAPEEHPVALAAKAVEMVKITRGQEGVDDTRTACAWRCSGGGCGGFEYALDFESEARANDWVYEQHGITVYVDAVSARYLEGTTVDYVLGMSGAGFKFNNPRASGPAAAAAPRSRCSAFLFASPPWSPPAP